MFKIGCFILLLFGHIFVINAADVVTKEIDDGSILAGYKYCGMQHTDDRFYTDNATAIDEFPWIVLLPHFVNGKKTSVCIGTIINRRYVLASASCIRYNNITVVELGRYHREKDVECVENPNFPECTDPALQVAVEDIIVHENFRIFEPLFGNIALLRLSKPLAYNDYIRPICFPSETSKRPLLGDVLFTSGWGPRQMYEGTPSDIKKRILQKVVPNEECYGGNPYRIVDESVMCTIPTVNDTSRICIGDNGAPLMYKIKHQWFIEGIVSSMTGERNCSGATTSIKIPYYKNWIQSKLRL